MMLRWGGNGVRTELLTQQKGIRGEAGETLEQEQV